MEDFDLDDEEKFIPYVAVSSLKEATRQHLESGMPIVYGEYGLLIHRDEHGVKTILSILPPKHVVTHREWTVTDKGLVPIESSRIKTN